MTLRLVGTQEERQCEGLGCAECPYKVVEADMYACELEDGWGFLYHAIDLWELVDVEKANTLHRLLKEDVERPDENGQIIVSPSLASRIVDQLTGLEQALLQLTDEHYRLRPDTIEPVLAQASHRVDTWNEAGKPIYTLSNALHDVINARKFLEKAIQLGRSVELEG
jgi:hypothetical protein